MTKIILGYTLCGIAIFGGLVFVSFALDLYWFKNAANIFGVPVFSGGLTGGGASTSPIFLGLCALAGAYMLRDEKG